LAPSGFSSSPARDRRALQSSVRTTLTEKGTHRPEFARGWPPCAAASMAAVAWSWRNGALLNWRRHCASSYRRRVLDSRFRGSPNWVCLLPLLTCSCFPGSGLRVVANGMQATIPSVLAYLAACVGIYRLARRWLEPATGSAGMAFLALNPNLLYLQTDRDD